MRTMNNNNNSGTQGNMNGNLNELIRLANNSNSQFNFSNVPPSLPLHLLQQNPNTNLNDVGSLNTLTASNGVPNVVISQAIPNMSNIGNVVNNAVLESSNGHNGNSTNKNKQNANHNASNNNNKNRNDSNRNNNHNNMSNSNNNMNNNSNNNNNNSSNKNTIKTDEVCTFLFLRNDTQKMTYIM